MLPHTLVLGVLCVTGAVAAPQASTTSTPILTGGTNLYGVPQTFSSTVSPSSSNSTGTPTGTVTFAIDGLLTTPQPLDSSGVASIGQNLSAGAHTISAHYDGDANFLPSPSAALNLTVAKADTSLTLAANPGQINQPISIRAAPATLPPSHGAVNGTVDFSSGGVAIPGCTGVAVQNGVAICTITLAQMGNYSVAATYNGDANTKPSAATFIVAVGKVVAGTYVAVAPDAPVYGQAVTLSALLMGATGVAAPTGSITFALGATSLPAVQVDSDGRAKLVIPSGALARLNAGAYTVTANYGGDDNYQSSKSDTDSFTVAKAETSLTVTAPAPQLGQPVALKAIVSLRTAGGVLGGTVSFSNGSTPITGCTAVALTDGAAVCTTTLTQQGTVSISATYSGDTNTASSSGTAQLTVSRAAATVSTAVTPTSPVFGAPVTVTASITVASGAPAPTGSVTFAEGSANLGTLTLGSDGRASLTIPSGTIAPLSVGSHTISASYGGDANYQAPQPATVAIVVAKAPTAVTLTSALAQLAQPVVEGRSDRGQPRRSRTGRNGGLHQFRSGDQRLLGRRATEWSRQLQHQLRATGRIRHRRRI